MFPARIEGFGGFEILRDNILYVTGRPLNGSPSHAIMRYQREMTVS